MSNDKQDVDRRQAEGGNRQQEPGASQGGNPNAGQNTGHFGSGSKAYDQADLATRANTANRQAAEAQAGNRGGTAGAEPASATRQNLTHAGAQQMADRDLGKMGNAGGKAPGVDVSGTGGKDAGR